MMLVSYALNMNIIYFILLIYKVVNCYRPVIDVCPAPCDCFGAIIDCSKNGLNEVPDDIPTWVEELNLSQNPNLNLENESLASLPHLAKLSLDEMELTSVPNLGSLDALRSLSLSGNSLLGASANWPKNFRNLEDIDFSKNKFGFLQFSEIHGIPLRIIDFKANGVSSISSLPSMSLLSLEDLRLSRNLIDDAAFKNLSVLFDSMPNLKSLDLNRNLLEHPQGLMFQNLSRLSVLKLKRNRIAELPAGVFYGLKSLTTLRLDNNSNITEINNGWLFDQHALKILSLSHNKIGLIKENAWVATEKLAVLDLSFNQLGCQGAEPSFSGLTALQELHLSHNCLSTLDENTFVGLLKLKVLDLSYNQLQRSVEYRTGAFRGLKSMTSLNLAYNNIDTIHVDVFEHLSSLTSLDLSGNNLKTLPQNLFRKVIHLSKFFLNSTNLVCDCHLTWLPQWLETRSIRTARSSCGFPERLKGKFLEELKANDFSCDESPQPLISKFPQNQTTLFGQNMTLVCIAYQGGDGISFTWTKDRKVVEPFYIKTFMNTEGGADGREPVTKIVSTLFIENVTHSDGGVYQCIARNSYGPSYSPPAKVVVHTFPYFTEKPVDVEVKEGGRIEMKCAATGYPLPDILLNKGGDFPAPREKRLFYSPNIYFIKPVLPKDEGTYICTARNEAGATNVTARVSVIFTPSFIRPLENQVAAIGQSVALECQGTGNPKPKVTWYKEGELVIPDATHVLLQDGQFLLLLRVEKKDTGTYLCELMNRLGTQRRKISLTLKSADDFFPALTGLIVMVAVVCIVLTSFLWVVIIYRWRTVSRGGGRKSGSDQTVQEPLNRPSIQALKNEDGGATSSPLLPQLPAISGQDSGSEHSSGKDSGVGEVNQRSSEDLNPNGEVKQGTRRSLLIYPDSPNAHSIKGHTTLGRLTKDELKPRLSSFGLDSSKPNNGGPIYASLRRGSTSRLLAVPSPVTPGMGMNSLPRHAFRGANTLSQFRFPDQYTSSLSRRRSSQNSSLSAHLIRSDSPEKITLRQFSREPDEETKEPKSPPSPEPMTPQYYCQFRSADLSKSNSLTRAMQFDLLPSR